jgi:hypothetical protein
MAGLEAAVADDLEAQPLLKQSDEDVDSGNDADSENDADAENDDDYYSDDDPPAEDNPQSKQSSISLVPPPEGLQVENDPETGKMKYINPKPWPEMDYQYSLTHQFKPPDIDTGDATQLRDMSAKLIKYADGQQHIRENTDQPYDSDDAHSRANAIRWSRTFNRMADEVEARNPPAQQAQTAAGSDPSVEADPPTGEAGGSRSRLSRLSRGLRNLRTLSRSYREVS